MQSHLFLWGRIFFFLQGPSFGLISFCETAFRPSLPLSLCIAKWMFLLFATIAFRILPSCVLICSLPWPTLHRAWGQGIVLFIFATTYRIHTQQSLLNDSCLRVNALSSPLTTAPQNMIQDQVIPKHRDLSNVYLSHGSHVYDNNNTSHRHQPNYFTSGTILIY